MLRRALFLILLAASVILAARVSEQHRWHMDLSALQINSLSASAGHALDAIAGQLELTAFVPNYPVQRAQLEQLLSPYLAHASRPRFSFVDPLREPDRARELGATRQGELQLRSGQRLEVIATPTAQSIDRALNRLALGGERWIVSFKGHGETSIDDSPAGLGQFVHHAEGLGYRFVSIDPRHVDELPENTAVLLIAGPRREYGEHTQVQIKRFLTGGGQLLWLLADQAPEFLSTDFGIDVLPGTVVDAAAALHDLDSPDNAIVSEYPAALLPQAPDRHSVLKRSLALTYRETDNWQLKARLQSSPRSWNEIGELRGQLARNPELGEQAGPLTIALALQHDRTEGPQRMVIVGNSHFVSNSQIGQADNMTLAAGLLHWLSANDRLSATTVAQDLDIDWPPQLAAVLAVGLMGLLPAIYLAVGLWSRSRRRKA